MRFFYEDVYKTPDGMYVKDPMAFVSGKDVYGTTITQVPINDMHLLVLGAPGMGKTVQIRKILSLYVLK